MLVRASALARSMDLLQHSQQHGRPKVRVLFYGQSITEQDWWREVAAFLKAQYPNADLQIDNLALGGFMSQLLSKSAETDLYPYHPDLLIFHVYGDHERYEEIIREVRARTNADVMLQTDHVLRPEDMREQTDPGALDSSASSFDAFMNHRHLPEVAARHDAAICDVRAAWKRQLARTAEPPSAYLVDEVHPNAKGNALLARIMKRCLREAAQRASAGPARASGVERVRVGSEATAQPRVEPIEPIALHGNRVDVASSTAGECRVRIDGQAPTSWPQSYTLTRALADEGGRWPLVFPRRTRGAAAIEHYTLTLEMLETDATEAPAVYAFRLESDLEGDEGQGRTDRDFESRSGHVKIAASDWNIAYALTLAKRPPSPPELHVRFATTAHALDSVTLAPPRRGATSSAVTVFQTAEPESHELVLEGDACAVDEVIVYDPAGREPSSE